MAGCLTASRRAASMVAMSIFFIGIIAATGRLANSGHFTVRKGSGKGRSCSWASCCVLPCGQSTQISSSQLLKATTLDLSS
jgi:hypothetical protein